MATKIQKEYLDDELPHISSGAGAPSSTPTKVGDIYIDTTNDDAYIAVGTASSSDWEKSNDGTGGGGVSDGDKGDITVSASGATWTIDNGAVTLAKQADMATASVVYRKTAGSGTPEVQTLATLKTDLGLTGTNSGDQDLSTLVVGPPSATDNAIVRYDGTTGKLVQNSGATLSDNGDLSISAAAAPFFQLNHTTTSSFSYATFRENGTIKANFYVIGSTFADAARQNNFEFDCVSGALVFRTAGLERMRVTSSGLELGNGADTTISRASAGLIAVEGVVVPTVSSTHTLTNKTLTSPKINEDVVLTATSTELNVLDGVTSTTAELNILDGVTATASELNALDGITATVTELNYTDGVTSAIQTQLDAKAPLAGPTLTGTTTVDRLDYDRAVGGVNAIGNLGATETIDWSTHTHYTGTLDSNITFTYSNQVSGQTITLYLSHDGSAARTITWPTTTWLDNDAGAAPTAPQASGNVLVVTLVYVGTTVYGSATGNYAVYA